MRRRRGQLPAFTHPWPFGRNGKFDKDLQEGGKKHDQFLKDVQRPHIRVDNLGRQQMDKLLHLKSDNPKLKKSQQQAGGVYDKMGASVKKGDMVAAAGYSQDTRDALVDMAEVLNEGQKRTLVIPQGGNVRSLGGGILGIGDPGTQKSR